MVCLLKKGCLLLKGLGPFLNTLFHFFSFLSNIQNPLLDGTDLSTMVGADRASGSGLDLQGYARYQNRSSVSYIWLLNLCLFVCLSLERVINYQVQIFLIYHSKLNISSLESMKPASIYAFKVNNRNTRKRCAICSKLTLQTPERPQGRRCGVFITDFEQILHLFLVFLLLTLNR